MVLEQIRDFLYSTAESAWIMQFSQAQLQVSQQEYHTAESYLNRLFLNFKNFEEVMNCLIADKPLSPDLEAEKNTTINELGLCYVKLWVLYCSLHLKEWFLVRDHLAKAAIVLSKLLQNSIKEILYENLIEVMMNAKFESALYLFQESKNAVDETIKLDYLQQARELLQQYLTSQARSSVKYRKEYRALKKIIEVHLYLAQVLDDPAVQAECYQAMLDSYYTLYTKYRVKWPWLTTNDYDLTLLTFKLKKLKCLFVYADKTEALTYCQSILTEANEQRLIDKLRKSRERAKFYELFFCVLTLHLNLLPQTEIALFTKQGALRDKCAVRFLTNYEEISSYRIKPKLLIAIRSVAAEVERLQSVASREEEYQSRFVRVLAEEKLHLRPRRVLSTGGAAVIAGGVKKSIMKREAVFPTCGFFEEVDLCKIAMQTGLELFQPLLTKISLALITQREQANLLALYLLECLANACCNIKGIHVLTTVELYVDIIKLFSEARYKATQARIIEKIKTLERDSVVPFFSLEEADRHWGEAESLPVNTRIEEFLNEVLALTKQNPMAIIQSLQENLILASEALSPDASIRSEIEDWYSQLTSSRACIASR
ncbi:MAG: hypothetical protein A3E87_07805 [Gammaproteobacteria bacterium RIFCSPHIGHO2_12_FULL_35_23]|nr:MAG: hypothetical protein A3E87_07805 [Gammaproteobacteria bacterium RIFCSPHIGHO2_12_FULL_35_23]